MKTSKFSVTAFLIAQTFFSLVPEAYAEKIGGVIPAEQMNKFCKSSAHPYMEELKQINHYKMKTAKGLTTYIQDSKGLDELANNYSLIKQRYIEQLKALNTNLGTGKAKDLITAVPAEKYLNSDLGQLGNTFYSAQDLETANKFFEFAADQEVNSSPAIDFTNIPLSEILGAKFTPVVHPTKVWTFTKAVSRFSSNKNQNAPSNNIEEQFSAIKKLSKLEDLPDNLKPDIIINLYKNKAPRTTELLSAYESLREVYECLTNLSMDQSCEKFLKPGETLQDLRVQIKKEETDLGKDFQARLSDDNIKALVTASKMNKIRKDTLQESIKFIKQQLDAEKHFEDQAYATTTIEDSDALAKMNPTEKRLHRIKEETAKESSLFLLFFDEKKLASNAKDLNDYEFNESLKFEMETAEKLRDNFTFRCLANEISNENQDYCLEQLEKSEEKIGLVQSSYIIKNKSSLDVIRNTLDDKEFQAIENLKNYFYNIYMKNCYNSSEVSKDVLIGCKEIDSNHVVLNNLFGNTYDIISSMNVNHMVNKKELSKETMALFQDACSYVNSENAPILNKEFCMHMRKGGTIEQRQKKVDEQKVITMNKIQQAERDYHFEYDPKSKNQLKKTKKQSWAMIAGKGILPVLPYTINQGMGIFQNKHQTESLLSTGLLQKQYLHNINYSWKYPVNSFTNPFLFGSANGSYNHQLFGDTTLPVTSPIGVGHGFNFGN